MSLQLWGLEAGLLDSLNESANSCNVGRSALGIVLPTRWRQHWIYVSHECWGFFSHQALQRASFEWETPVILMQLKQGILQSLSFSLWPPALFWLFHDVPFAFLSCSCMLPIPDCHSVELPYVHSVVILHCLLVEGTLGLDALLEGL